MGVKLPALIAAVLVTLAIAACGSRSGGSTTGAGGPAARAVRHALAAIQNRAFRETFSEDITLDTSHLPSAEATRLRAFSGTVTGTADVVNSRNFRIVVTLHGVHEYVRAIGGQLSISQDGANYQPAPAPTTKQFSQLVSLAPGILGHIQNAKSLGTARLSGRTVNRYSATIPANAVAPAFSALNFGSGKPGPLSFTIDVDPSSGLPLRFSDAESASLDLSKLKRPGVTGVLSVRVTSVRNFRFR
jgi:hypothetical protein